MTKFKIAIVPFFEHGSIENQERESNNLKIVMGIIGELKKLIKLKGWQIAAAKCTNSNKQRKYIDRTKSDCAVTIRVGKRELSQFADALYKKTDSYKFAESVQAEFHRRGQPDKSVMYDPRAYTTLRGECPCILVELSDSPIHETTTAQLEVAKSIIAGISNTFKV